MAGFSYVSPYYSNKCCRMKLVSCAIVSLMCHFAHAAVEPSIQNYLQLAEQKKLDQHITWQRLMYADQAKKSEVTYNGYFYAQKG